MEPRVRANGDQAQQNFSDPELAQLLFAHGDIRNPLPSTIRTLDSITTDYIIQICFGAAQSAALHNRAKVKIDDVMFALRKNPGALGRIEEMQEKSKVIQVARKAIDTEGDIAGKVGEFAQEDGGKKGAKGKGKKRKADGGEGLGDGFQNNLKKSKGKAFA